MSIKVVRRNSNVCSGSNRIKRSYTVSLRVNWLPFISYTVRITVNHCCITALPHYWCITLRISSLIHIYHYCCCISWYMGSLICDKFEISCIIDIKCMIRLIIGFFILAFTVNGYECPSPYPFTYTTSRAVARISYTCSFQLYNSAYFPCLYIWSSSKAFKAVELGLFVRVY